MTKIKVKQDSFDAIIQRLNKISATLGDSSSGAFSALAGNELLSGGISKLQNNVSMIGSRTGGTASVINKGRDSFSGSEAYLETVVDAIELPTDLKNVYTPYEETTQETTLNKNDGKSVNSDQNTKQEELKELNETDEKGLGDITKAEVKDEQLIDMFDRKLENLGDIEKAGGDIEQSLDEYTLTEGTAMGELTGGNTKEQAYEDAYTMQKNDELQSVVTAGGDKVQEYEDTLADATGTVLTNINGSGTGESAEFKDNYGDGTVKLGNISGGTAGNIEFTIGQ